ncbi:MAG TPA: hypothetical protein VFW73_07085 [Lacipirellulaceae bacterium]|nr:hypothetical protein [Lacipirellulaceae bacterium]
MVFILPQPALADIGEVLMGLVAVIFLVVRQILEANRQAGPQRPRVPQAPQPQAGNKPPIPQGAGQQADPLRAQVEDFLRRANRPPQPGQRAQPPVGPQRAMLQQPQQRPSQPAPSSGIQVLVDPQQTREERKIGQPLRQAEWRNKPSTAPIAGYQAPSIPAKPRTARTGARRRRQTVAEHVAEQVTASAQQVTASAQSLAEKASQLGHRIVAEDQQFDVQLKAKFDHAVGTLAGDMIPAAAQPMSSSVEAPAAQLASMLANPDGIRQAILINEILRRPSERW